MHSVGSNEPEVFPNPANIFRQQQQSQFQFQEPQQPQVQDPHQQQQQQEQLQLQEPKPSEPSICIPRVFKSTTRKDIHNVMDRLDLGTVDRIDMVAKTNERGESYYKVFIHFKAWNKRNTTAQDARTKLLHGEEIKIVYSEPWFWKCTASRVDKPAFRDYSAPPPRIDLGGCRSLSVVTMNTPIPTQTIPTQPPTQEEDDVPCYD
jgi:hypothetical protein